MTHYKKNSIFLVFILIILPDYLFSKNFQVNVPSVIVMAGQTLEVPLYRSHPIGADLTARGRFQEGDVSFIPSPKCHLSAHDCTLIITASPNSQNYTAVPVVVSQSGSNYKSVFVLSVIHQGQRMSLNPKLPKVISKPLMMSNETGNEVNLTITNTTASILKNLTAIELPPGVNTSICSMLAPHMSCTLKIFLDNIVESGDYIFPIQSDQGILQYHILSITAPKKNIFSPPAVHLSKPLLTSSSGNLTASIIPHSVNTTYYTSTSNGPIYQMIQVTNIGSTAVTLNTPTISGTDASFFSIDTLSSHYQGTPTFCYNTPTLANGDSCFIIIQSTLGDPRTAPATATLQISDGISADTLNFALTDTTYVYAGGGFNTLGNASVSGGNLLAQCTAGTCSNALQGTTGNNYAYINNSVGQWINAIAVTPSGNLIVGGVFGGIGGAVSGASSGTAALLAQCIPGSSISGNACLNQINTGSTTNPFFTNNAYIDSISFTGNNTNIIIGGDFRQVRTISLASGKLLARCSFSGASPNISCSNFITSGATNFANNSITALTTIPLSTAPFTGGLFTQIAGYPSSAPSTGTTFAMCSSSSCSQGMGGSNPNNSILGMTNDGTDLYIGGTFTSIGGYTDSSGGYPLVKCTPATTTTCINALNGSNNANGYIEGVTYLSSNLYVGGQFTSIGGATPVSTGNMLAVCSTSTGACTNLISDSNPYATGVDWRGGIFAVAIGNQTSITEI